MSERAPYSRVYWSIIDDPKFADVYDDDRRLATWLRLLLAADQSYPASPSVPLGTNVKALQSLVDAGLIDRGTGARFRVRGLAKERARRRPVVAGPPPVDPQDWTSPAPVVDHDRNGTQGLSQAEQSNSKDETSTARAPDPADAYWSLTGKYPNGGALSWIDDMSSSYGPGPVVRAIANAHLQDRAVSTLLGRAQDILRSEARALSLKEQANVRQDLKERRAAPRADIDPEALAAEIQRIREEAA